MTEFKVSSFCTGGGCVEVGHLSTADIVDVRDAKDPLRQVVVSVTAKAWASFLDSLRGGDFNRGR